MRTSPFLPPSLTNFCAWYSVPSLPSTEALYTYFEQTRPGLVFGVETPEARKALEKFVSLYPDNPAAGSPFGTGNETWGKGRSTKRGAAVFGDWLFEVSRLGMYAVQYSDRS